MKNQNGEGVEKILEEVAMQGVAAVAGGWPTQYCPACRKMLYERGETELPVVGKCCHCGTFIERSMATGRYEIPSANDAY